MKTVYISLGSNVGDRAMHILGAVAALDAAGIHVQQLSSLYETAPVDAPPQAWFLNAVVEAETDLLPRAVLRAIREIEKNFGRRRTQPRGPRTLDLDVLLYGKQFIRTEELQVPHPRMAARRFVLVPLAEIASALRHPVLRKTIEELLVETPDKGQIRKWQPTNRGAVKSAATK